MSCDDYPESGRKGGDREKPGDWYCGAGHLVFSKNSNCRLCGEARNSASVVVGKGKGNGKGNGKAKGAVKIGRIQFHGENLLEARKNLISGFHPSIDIRAPHQNDSIRAQHGIHVISDKADLPPPIDTFGEECPFPDWITTQLRQNFEKPTPIQIQAWPAALQGWDIIGIAETGSGKTLAYTLPMLAHIQRQPELEPGDGPIGLVLLPTKNLVQQVADVITVHARYSPENLKCLPVDSLDFNANTDEAQRRCHILVATPGRLLDILERREDYLRRTTFVVLDEGDELIDSTNLQAQICYIASRMRRDRQVMYFSATWYQEAEQIVNDVMECAPITIVAGGFNLSACKNITQQFEQVGDTVKMDLFVDKLNSLKDNLSPEFKVLIFVNQKETIAEVLQAIRERCNIPTAEGYSGNERKQVLEEVLGRFRSRDSDCRVLVATQVLGRGVDIPEIKLVINFDMPWNFPEYIHRIGRTGRAGGRGCAWTLLEDHDLAGARDLRDILQNSEQLVPSFIQRACGQLQHYKGKRQEWRSRQAAKDATKAKNEAENPTHGSCSNSFSAKEQNSPDLVDSGVPPYYELRNKPGLPPEYFCTLCGMFSNPAHERDEQHVQRVNLYRMQQKHGRELVRSLDESTGRYYWYDPVTGSSEWEVLNNQPPESIRQAHDDQKRQQGMGDSDVDDQQQKVMSHSSADQTRQKDLGHNSVHDQTQEADPWYSPECHQPDHTLQLGLDRYYDVDKRRHYWYDPVTCVSAWEVEENRPPEHIVKNSVPGQFHADSTIDDSLEVCLREASRREETQSSLPKPSTPVQTLESRYTPEEAAETAEAGRRCESADQRYAESDFDGKGQLPLDERPMASKVLSQGLERHFDEKTDRYYWFDPATEACNWEVNEKQPPADMIFHGTSSSNNEIIEQIIEHQLDDVLGNSFAPEHRLPENLAEAEAKQSMNREGKQAPVVKDSHVIATANNRVPKKDTEVEKLSHLEISASAFNSELQKLERHFDAKAERHFWYDPISECSKWEIRDNEPPPDINRACAAAPARDSVQQSSDPWCSPEEYVSDLDPDDSISNVPWRSRFHRLGRSSRSDRRFRHRYLEERFEAHGRAPMGNAVMASRVTTRDPVSASGQPPADARYHVDPWHDPSKSKVCELRDTGWGPQWWCKLCRMSITDGHLNSEVHKQNQKRLGGDGRARHTSPAKASRPLQEPMRSAACSAHVRLESVPTLEQSRKRPQSLIDNPFDPWVATTNETPACSSQDLPPTYDRRVPQQRPSTQGSIAKSCQASQNQSFYELRNLGDAGPRWFCTLCNTVADAAHSTTDGHLRRRDQWFQKWEEADELERHFDATTHKYFWFNKKLGTSKWEVEEKIPPTFSSTVV